MASINNDISKLKSGENILKYINKDYSECGIKTVDDLLNYDLDSKHINWSKHHIRHFLLLNKLFNKHDIAYLESLDLETSFLSKKITSTSINERTAIILQENDIVLVMELLLMNEVEFNALDGLGPSRRQHVHRFMDTYGLKFKKTIDELTASSIKNIAVYENNVFSLSGMTFSQMEEEYTKLSERNKVIRLQIKQLKEEEEENKRRMIKIQKQYNTSKR